MGIIRHYIPIFGVGWLPQTEAVSIVVMDSLVNNAHSRLWLHTVNFGFCSIQPNLRANVYDIKHPLIYFLLLEGELNRN